MDAEAGEERGRSRRSLTACRRAAARASRKVLEEGLSILADAFGDMQ